VALVIEREKILTLGERVISGERIDADRCVDLLKSRWISELGYASNAYTLHIHPDADQVCTFVIDANINYTNICTSRCRFCAFYREKGHPEAYVRSRDEILAGVSHLVKHHGTQVMLQGGHNPDLPFDYYLDILKSIKKRFPSVHIHSFSPPEILFFSKIYGMDIDSVLQELKDAGLDSLPGGGAEILVDRVRKKVSPGKGSTASWLEVMRIAHEKGLPSTATMMYGHAETLRDRAEHLLRIRELQDETRGFTAFIPWSYQPAEGGPGRTRASPVDYLRLVAASRLMLDNISNIQAGWLTEGGEIAQIALGFGANDFGGVILGEEVLRSTGTDTRLDLEDILDLIRRTGRTPVQRDTYYHRIRRYSTKRKD